MAEFGAGPYLTQNLDFEVTNTGDIRATTGTDELQKDIALFAIAALEPLVGSQQTPETRGQISSTTTDILNADPRVEQVLSVDVRFTDTRSEAEVVADVLTDDGEQELVFSLE